jgi:hypothetical protein
MSSIEPQSNPSTSTPTGSTPPTSASTAPSSASNASDASNAGGAPAPKGTKKSAARFVTPALVLVAVLGLGIFGGVLIGQNTGASTTEAGGMPNRGDATGQEMPTGAGGGMGGFTSGTVVSIDGDTITLETSDGEQVTVTTTDDTTVTTTEESDVASLATGDSLTITGEADDTGDVAATSISEGETSFGGPGGGGAPGAGGTTDDATE